MLTNIDQDLRGHNMVNIHNQLAALLCWEKLRSDC